MAKPLVTLHFHAEDPFGAVLDAARAASRDDLIRNSASFADFDTPAGGRVLPPLLRLANSLGVPVLLSMTNERLVRALADPAEHKALSDGVSRGRFLPTPAPALGAELRLLAPFEVADELRLNIDLWKLAMITPPFTAQPRSDQRVVLYQEDPAAMLGTVRPVRSTEPAILGLDLGSIVRSGDPEGALARLTAALQQRKDFRLAAPNVNPHGWADRMLADILTASGSYPVFDPERDNRFDVGSDGFSLELARQLSPPAACARTFAKNLGEVLDSGFDFTKLDAEIGRGLLLRRLARAGVPDGIPVIERVRASFQIAVILLDSLLTDESALGGEIENGVFDLAATIPAIAGREIDRKANETREDPSAPQSLEGARKQLASIERLVPSRQDSTDRKAVTLAVRNLAAAALAVFEELGGRVQCEL